MILKVDHNEGRRVKDGSKSSERPSLMRMKPSPSLNRKPDQELKKMDQPNLEGTIGAQLLSILFVELSLNPRLQRGNFYPCCGSQVVFRKVNPGKNKSIVRY